MIKVYCNYGLYDEDTAESREVGDDLEEIVFYDGLEERTLKNVHITDIDQYKIEVETEDFDIITIDIDDILEWKVSD